jgi:hypothetical protein
LKAKKEEKDRFEGEQNAKRSLQASFSEKAPTALLTQFNRT